MQHCVSACLQRGTVCADASAIAVAGSAPAYSIHVAAWEAACRKRRRVDRPGDAGAAAADAGRPAALRLICLFLRP